MKDLFSRVAPIAPPTRERSTAASAPALLSLRGIVQSWSPQLPPVLDGVDLELARGSVVVVTGANGVGKTTLLRIAAGLLTPERGEVRLLGLDPERQRSEYNRRLGFLAAGNTGLYARLNVDQQLELWGRLALMSRTERREATGRLVEAFDLEPLRGRRVDRLSMGQRQRLRLALVFLHQPDLVMLDEPHTSLDKEGTTRLQGAIDALRGRGGAALICAPELDRQRIAADRCYTVRDAVLVEAP